MQYEKAKSGGVKGDPIAQRYFIHTIFGISA